MALMLRFLMGGILCLLLLTACDPPQSEEKIPNPELALLNKLQESSQLGTVEFVLSKVVMGSKKETILGFSIGESDFLAETKAYVTAGINLTELSAEDIRITGNAINLQLPPVKVLNFSYPAEEFKVNREYTRDWGFSELSKEEIDAFYQQAESAVKKDLKWLAIEQTAEEKTTLFLQKFLYQAGYKEVYISFKNPNAESVKP